MNKRTSFCFDVRKFISKDTKRQQRRPEKKKSLRKLVLGEQYRVLFYEVRGKKKSRYTILHYEAIAKLTRQERNQGQNFLKIGNTLLTKKKKKKERTETPKNWKKKVKTKDSKNLLEE